VPTLADAAPAFERQMAERLDAKYLRLIRNWQYSDCASAIPDAQPTREMAPNWEGFGTRCGSCSRCRPEQRAPLGTWDDWLYLGGRGTGKTRSCAEYVANAVATNLRWRVAIVAPTFADARDICVEGESGLLAIFERWGWIEGVRADYTWNRSIGELIIASTGSRVKLFSAEKPARLRGPQHHLVWVEELAQVVKRASDAWDMLKFGLRLGRHPRTVCSTTPLPLSLIRDMLVDKQVAVTRGKTDDNAANLPAVTLRALHKKYDGTALGRQELGGDLINDVPGALWKRVHIDTNRIQFVDLGQTFADDNELLRPERPELMRDVLASYGITITRIVIAVDPAVESTEDADETGMIVVGKGNRPNSRESGYYVLDDVTLRDTPDMVMDRLVDAYDLWEANDVIGEVNNGGQYISKALRDTLKLRHRRPSEIPFTAIRAKKGKRVRAEPVAVLYKPGVVAHVGEYKHLEDQLCVWTTDENESPDRMDALCYAVLHLSETGEGSGLYRPTGEVSRHNQQRSTYSTSSVGSRRR
jgi:phage terminase large subunit-like protein